MGNPEAHPEQNADTGRPWYKSSFADNHGNHVELGQGEAAGLPPYTVGMRNPGSPEGPIIQYTPAEIAAFIAGVRAGEFDCLLEDATPAQESSVEDTAQQSE